MGIALTPQLQYVLSDILSLQFKRFLIHPLEILRSILIDRSMNFPCPLPLFLYSATLIIIQGELKWLPPVIRYEQDSL